MKLTVLGSTGSVGTSTLAVVDQHPGRFEIVALTGNSRVDQLADQCLRYRPKLAVVGDAAAARTLQARLRAAGLGTQVQYGVEGLVTAASLPEVDAVMAAIVGAAGLPPTLAAARCGKRVLLANKEALVMAGQLFMDEVSQGKATLLPIDSEHNALFQAMPPFRSGERPAGVRKILLTASGGPFRTRSLDALADVTVAQAVAHPNWTMGQKISVDSATMMNKGLEVIEAHWLFSMPADDISVVIHPQSIVHSLVDYLDGSMLAQLGNPDMRVPIAHALAWPERVESGVPSLDLARAGRLDFEAPDMVRFRCLDLAYEVLRAGQDRAVVLNAANEVAVAAFLQQRIRFLDIPGIVEQVLTSAPVIAPHSLDDIRESDAASRALADALIARYAP